ncbi:MAG: hypothetical protein AAB784_02755 [Patescibacteria group bacterium]
MGNKIFAYGIAIFLVGGAGWFVAVILAVITLGKLRDAANFLGVATGVGFLMIIIGGISKLLNRHKKHEK